MKPFSFIKISSLFYLVAAWILIKPIPMMATPSLKQYITLDRAAGYNQPMQSTYLLQKHSQLDVPFDKNINLWVNLYDRSEGRKISGGNLQLHWPTNYWSSFHVMLGGLAAPSTRGVPVQLEEMFSQLHVMMGDLKQYPVACQVGLFDLPFGRNASHILPAELKYTQQICRPLRKKIGLNLILATPPVAERVLVNFFLALDLPSLTKQKHHMLSGGISTHCPLTFYKWLKSNVGGGIYIHTTHYQRQWNIYAETLLNFWRIYVEMTQMQNDYVAFHAESSVHFSVLQRPTALVGLFEHGRFGKENVHNDILAVCKVQDRKYLSMIVGVKIDANQLVHKVQGQPDAWSKLSSFILRIELAYP